MFDIYVFNKINKLMPIDVKTITEVLEISHVIRLNWVSPVRRLAKKQMYQGMN